MLAIASNTFYYIYQDILAQNLHLEGFHCRYGQLCLIRLTKLNRPQSDWASFMIVEAEYQSLSIVVLTDADYIWHGQFFYYYLPICINTNIELKIENWVGVWLLPD